MFNLAAPEVLAWRTHLFYAVVVRAMFCTPFFKCEKNHLCTDPVVSVFSPLNHVGTHGILRLAVLARTIPNYECLSTRQACSRRCHGQGGQPEKECPCA